MAANNKRVGPKVGTGGSTAPDDGDCNKKTADKRVIGKCQGFSTALVLPHKTLEEMGYKAEEFKAIDRPVKSNLYDKLKSMMNAGVCPDITINIGRVQYHCYSMILNCYSKTIFDLEIATSLTLPAQYVSADAFKLLYNWMITEKKVSVKVTDLIELIDASIFLKIDSFTEQCVDHIHDDGLISEDRVFMMYLEAKKRHFNFIRPLLGRRISKFFVTLVAYQDFVVLDLAEVSILLESCSIGVNSELETFMAAIRWLNYDWPNREQHIVAVMEMIRFNLMAPWVLSNLQRPNAAPEVKRVVRVERVKELINEAIISTSKCLFNASNWGKINKHMSGHMTDFKPRAWIYDPFCDYHHNHSCSNMMNFFSYNAFLHYLRFLKLQPLGYWQHLAPAFGADECRCKNIKDSSSIFVENQPIIRQLMQGYGNRETGQDSKKQSSQETTASVSSEQERACHTSMLGGSKISTAQKGPAFKEFTCSSSSQEATGPTSTQVFSGASSSQDCTGSSYTQEFTGPSSSQECTGSSYTRDFSGASSSQTKKTDKHSSKEIQFENDPLKDLTREIQKTRAMIVKSLLNAPIEKKDTQYTRSQWLCLQESSESEDEDPPQERNRQAHK